MKDLLISSSAAKVHVKSVMRLTSALLFFACACVAADFPTNLKKDIDAGNQVEASLPGRKWNALLAPSGYCHITTVNRMMLKVYPRSPSQSSNIFFLLSSRERDEALKHISDRRGRMHAPKPLLAILWAGLSA